MNVLGSPSSRSGVRGACLTIALLLIFSVSRGDAQKACTARHLVKSADSLAATLADRSTLSSIETASMDTTGRAITWTYEYLAEDTVNTLNSKVCTLVGEGDSVRLDHWSPLSPVSGF